MIHNLDVIFKSVRAADAFQRTPKVVDDDMILKTRTCKEECFDASQFGKVLRQRIQSDLGERVQQSLQLKQVISLGAKTSLFYSYNIIIAITIQIIIMLVISIRLFNDLFK